MEFSGVAVVVEHGRPIVQRAHGLADSTTGDPCTLETAFQICSGSKQFTAYAILLCAERGLLSLDDTVAPGVSIHSLLCQTSGLGHWESIPGLDLARLSSAAETERLIAGAPVGEPVWRYSSPNYVLLARLVEKVSGVPYARFVASEIFEPLGMTGSSVAEPPPGAARGHRGGVLVESMNLPATPGAGDIWSTAADLVRFASHRAFDPGMFAPHTTITDGWCTTSDGWCTAEAYGYGVGIGRIGGQRAYFHPGDNSGFQSFRAWFPDDDRAVVVLSNDDACDLEPVLCELFVRP